MLNHDYLQNISLYFNNTNLKKCERLEKLVVVQVPKIFTTEFLNLIAVFTIPSFWIIFPYSRLPSIFLNSLTLTSV